VSRDQPPPVESSLSWISELLERAVLGTHDTPALLDRAVDALERAATALEVLAGRSETAAAAIRAVGPLLEAPHDSAGPIVEADGRLADLTTHAMDHGYVPHDDGRECGWHARLSAFVFRHDGVWWRCTVGSHGLRPGRAWTPVQMGRGDVEDGRP
jgi:hypothetical protein